MPPCCCFSSGNSLWRTQAVAFRFVSITSAAAKIVFSGTRRLAVRKATQARALSASAVSAAASAAVSATVSAAASASAASAAVDNDDAPLASHALVLVVESLVCCLNRCPAPPPPQESHTASCFRCVRRVCEKRCTPIALSHVRCSKRWSRRRWVQHPHMCLFTDVHSHMRAPPHPQSDVVSRTKCARSGCAGRQLQHRCSPTRRRSLCTTSHDGRRDV